MYASSGGQDTMVQWLIKNGSNVHQVDKHGMTALTYVALLDRRPIARARIYKSLIENGVDVNQVDKNGFNALLHATTLSDIPFAESLVEFGADVNLLTTIGTALSIASVKTPFYPLCRFFILAGAVTEADNIGNREKCVYPVVSPLSAIRKVVASHKSYDALLSALQKGWINPIQGFIFFAFEYRKNGVDVFGDSASMSFLKERGWGPKTIGMVQSIIQRLLELQCTDLNVLYVVSPFISTADDETLRRLSDSLDFLTNDIPGVVRPNVESNGRILNAMMQRSAHLGFRPVLKAVYTIRNRMIESQRVFDHFRVPAELLRARGILSRSLEP